jgi:Secretion system C-terminal sorting domain
LLDDATFYLCIYYFIRPHMRSILRSLMAFAALSFWASSLSAQCPNDNSLAFGAPTDLTPSSVGNTRTNVQIWGGEYATVNAISGGTYTIQTCASAGFNTHITLYRESNGAMLTFNDNAGGCGDGNQSRVNYTSSFTGVMRVVLDEMPGCAGGGSNWTLSVQLTGVVDVEWLGFTGTQRGNAVALAWETANEYRSSHFIVERSDDAVHFEAIGRVNSAGQSSEQQTYTFDDRQPLVGRNYYRITEVNLEGQTDAHADVVSVLVEGDPGLSLLGCYPNPASTAVQVRLLSPDDAACVASLLDLSGRLLRQWDLPATTGVHEHTLPVADLAAGTYLLQVRQGNLSAHRKLVIQH